ncbi:MAG TPA: cation-translocating P-type ATPase [Chryseosolibacter sp.]
MRFLQGRNSDNTFSNDAPRFISLSPTVFMKTGIPNMPGHQPHGVWGLTGEEVLESRRRHGRNEVVRKEYPFLTILKDSLRDPMVWLLTVATLLYFVSGETGDAVFMASAIVFVTGISLYQESRSRNALEALKSLTAPTCKVIRNGETVEIGNEEIVIDDYMIVDEGKAIPADGLIVHSYDFSVNESILTGESLAVTKTGAEGDKRVFQGTTVVTGLAICKVTAIGADTALGKIGMSVGSMGEEVTPLLIQIRHFVKLMALVGMVIFFIVWAINYFESRLVLGSLLRALTLAMSILPEEIPVAFTTFMALGTWRLMKLGVIVRNIKTVETLGSASVICLDKTGTITENRMALARVFALSSEKISDAGTGGTEELNLIRMAMWASEPIPFDPMETALHDAYSKMTAADERQNFRLIHEYPLSGRPPMMTHIFENTSGQRIIAAKGAPEAILAVCQLSERERTSIQSALKNFSEQGFRVLAVAGADFEGNDFPVHQQQFIFRFTGLVAFYDPPKRNIKSVFNDFYRAGIAVKILTGDHAETTATIARLIDFRGAERTIDGQAVMEMSDEEINRKVLEFNIFTRVYPDAKLRILNALKANDLIVAMTGDGVNDGPALKAAHIGIAMGKRGSEIAKQVSSLILTDDDLSKMVDAVAMGRKIYSNLKKAIQYIISIHIPIILTVFVPLALGWVYPAIFSPVHVIFLELIMGPTCSIIYENEPIEENLMRQKPRPFTTTFFHFHELNISIIQGVAITVATLAVYQLAAVYFNTEATTRTMVFITLISANIFLTLVNRSFFYSIFTTLRYRNHLIFLIIGITIALTLSILFIPPVMEFFQFTRLTTLQAAIAVLSGSISVLWFELLKVYKRLGKKNP